MIREGRLLLVHTVIGPYIVILYATEKSDEHWAGRMYMLELQEWNNII